MAEVSAKGAKGALTRKIGPLPAWGWGVAIGGALLGVKLLRGGGDSTQRTVIEVPTGAPTYAPEDFASDLGSRVSELGETINDALSDVQDDIGDINARIDDLETMPGPGMQPPPNAQPSGYNDPLGATYNTSTGAWTIHDWSLISPGRLADIAWANVAGRGPRTGSERDPIVNRFRQLIEVEGKSPQEAYSIVAPTLSGYRGT